jgi:lysophospholipase L1-like esterase
MLIALGLIFAAAGLVLVRLFYLASRRPSNDTRSYLQARSASADLRCVVCAGDSLTHASFSGDYVRVLRERFAEHGYAFVNAGVNGDTSADLLRRLDGIIACRPSAVTILIGTNDCRSGPIEPARARLTAILTRLSRETQARIALLSIPPLGEDLSSSANQRVVAYNALVRELAGVHGVDYLPLHETLCTSIERAALPPSALEFSPALVLSVGLRRYLLGRGWDDIAHENGLAVLTDQLHTSQRAAALIADIIANWLDPPA